ncbi:protein regulator of cytokinesis 1-like isoform X2 [Schistocerca americana]|uniref:protein regulator of cytokinesis 1-like isoform X2 n=1 Tax=Schistocerca americana TaxID=7009 RepID=UPI001F501B14|nr:protein regulator of cytokinesis 1-like isoform X2 [Schistocerca americana]
MTYFQRLDCAEQLEKQLQKLHQIWDEIGYGEEDKVSREKQVKKHLLHMFEDMVLEEDNAKEQIIKSIEDLLKEAEQLGSEIGVKIPVDNNEYEMLPLCQVEEDLTKKVSEYRELKQERLSYYSKLRAKEKELCERLGLEDVYEIPNAVPSEEQLSQFEVYIKFKADEKDRLTNFFYQTRSSIMEIMRELEMTPLLDFEKKVVCEDEDSFKLSKENIAKLKELHNTLVQKLEDTKALSMELREKLCKLWDRLHESFDARTAFLDAHSGYSVKTIEALKTEITRCEEKKRQNIKIFVENIRQEIHNLWDKCCFGETQRRKFIPYFSDCYTEDLLGLHELEIERLKKFYDTNKPLFQLMEKRQKLWEKMIALESKANDRDRLFNNRGGQLLREEKERKVIQKELPKIEEEISHLVKSYEETNHEPFLFYDQKLSSLIEDQWNKHQEEKKIARKTRGAETEFRPPIKRKAGVATCSSSSKVTPIINRSKNIKVTRTLFPLAENGHLQNTGTTHTLKSQPSVMHMHDESIASTTYADFESHLDTADARTLRSSLKRRCLRDRNDASSRPHTPASTCKSTSSVSRSKMGFHQQRTNGTITPSLRRVRTPVRTPLRTPPSSASRSCRLTSAQRGKLPIII